MSFFPRFRPLLILSGFLLSLLLGFAESAVGQTSSVALRPTDSAPTDLSLTQQAQKTVLDNGLTVLTKEVHTAPVVSVQVWYRVGSRNEGPGINGISHQLEHLLFKGTTSRPIQFGRLFSALGSQSNAFTSYDQTAYYGTVESDKLEALLVLEADRMKNALIDAAQLDSEKRVVVSELQGYENSPDYRLGRAVMRAAFPDHPYGLPVGGTKADVEGFTVEQVVDYYKTFYSPENATLIITGDFSTEKALQSVEATFGQIERGATQRPERQQGQASSRRDASPQRQPIVLREPGSSTLINAVYPLPAITHPDVPAIDLMDMVLTGGRSSRLNQALIESGLASSITAYPYEMIEPGWYDINVTVAPGGTAQAVDEALLKALSDIRETRVSEDELNRARTQLKAYFVMQNQDITSQASQLGYNQTSAGDYQYSDRYLAALDLVTVDDIQRVARTYLAPEKRFVGYFEPTLANGQPGASGETETGRTAENFSPGAPVDPAEVARYLPPSTSATQSASHPLPTEITLGNGLKVMLLRDPSVPVVNLSGWVKAGIAFDSSEKAGLAQLTANNLLNGTDRRDALTLAKNLEDEGASLDFEAFREGVKITSSALSESLPTVLDTLSDVLQSATFPADQVELTRQRAIAQLQVELDDPSDLAWREFRQAIYPANHPFHTYATEASLKAITRDDIRKFYQTHYRPDSTQLTLVGNFDPDTVRSLLESKLGSWKVNGARPSVRFPQVSLPPSVVRVQKQIPGKAEAVTYLGYNGISRNDRRYYAAAVLNQILGGDTLSSRLGTEIRDRQGLTYGIFSFFQPGIEPGVFAIVMQTAPENADRAINLTLSLLQQVRQQGVTEAELETAKRSLSSSYVVSLASPDTVAATVMNHEFYGLRPTELVQFPEKIAAVTMADINQVIQDLVHPDKVVIVTAGPPAP